MFGGFPDSTEGVLILVILLYSPLNHALLFLNGCPWRIYFQNVAVCFFGRFFTLFVWVFLSFLGVFWHPFFTIFHAFSSSKIPLFFSLLFEGFLRFFHTPKPRKSPSRVGETLIFGKAPLLSFNAFSMEILPQNPRKKPQKTLPKPMQNGTLFFNAEI